MKTSDLRAVLFDLDGTLLPIDFDSFLPRYLKRLFGWYLRTSGVDIAAPSMAAISVMMKNDGSRTNSDAFWGSNMVSLGFDRARFEEIYADFIITEGSLLGEGVAADPAARELVDALRSRGMRTALATNPVFPMVMIQTRARWAGLDSADFDLVTCSDRMRYCKPSLGYYRQVSEMLGIDPSECLMVGNDLAMDLEPAARVGMRTCLVRSEYTVQGDSTFRPDCTCRLSEVASLLHESRA
jgi:HAD superfamily hydrolase (TIGR01509 family)